MKKSKLVLVLFLGMYACAIAQTKTFTNPLLPSGADPYSFYKDGYYYYTYTTGSRLVIWKTKNLAELKTTESKTIFVPPAGTSYSKDLRAPAIHFIQGKWVKK